jgi:hypothetical protein
MCRFFKISSLALAAALIFLLPACEEEVKHTIVITEDVLFVSAEEAGIGKFM